MSCRESLEIDFPAFLAEPRSAGFAAFREHYPTCSECSAEVRAWTELHGLLALGPSGGEDAHPAEALLLRFDENPAGLAPSERRSIEAHLAACPSCTDELRALRGFQFAEFEQRAAGESAAWRGWIERLGAGVRGLVLHPAFAYALVLVLLYPLVLEQWSGPGRWDQTRDWGGPGRAPQEPRAPALLEQAFEEEPRDAGVAVSEEEAQDSGMGALPKGRNAPVTDRVARLQPPADPPASRLMKAKKATQIRDASGYAAAEKPSPKKRSEQTTDAEFDVEERVLRGHGVPSLRLRAPESSPPRAPKGEMNSAAVPATAVAGASAARKDPTMSLTPGRLVEISGAQVRAGVRLQVPVPSTAGDGSWVEVRVVAPDERREIRERFRLDVGQTQVALRLPVGWALDGTHRVELYLIDMEHTTPPAFESGPHPHSLFRFSFRVDPDSGGRMTGGQDVP